jgi:arylsulfatase A-like enzyme
MKPNVILLICDSMRKSIMNMYNGPAKLPNFNKLAKDSMVYDNCIAPETWTFPSHTSMFTGMYANEHGIHETKERKISWLVDANSRLKTKRLAERMQEKGYKTLCISNNYMLTRHTGFDYGFDNFLTLESSPWSQSKVATEARELGADPMQVFNTLVKSGRFGTILKYTNEMMRIKKVARIYNYPLHKGSEFTNELLTNTTLNEPFFLFLNFWEMHEPYVGFSDTELINNLVGIKKFSQSKVDFLRNQYVLEAEFVDRQVGRLVEMLKAREMYEDTLLIVTSDHGQEFNEHGYMYHGTYLHDEIVRVPLMVKYPSSKKFRQRKGYQSLVNIPKLIESAIAGRDDSAITTDKAFAEAYGNIDFIPKSFERWKPYIDQTYEKFRKAIFMDGYKLTLNGTDGTVEEFMREGKSIDADENKEILMRLVGEIREFKGKEAFRLPEGM